MQDAIHRFPVRVYYEDTDMAGIVYHANYLKFIERARSDWVKRQGLDQNTLRERDGIVFVVRRIEADYLATAKYDDALEVRTTVRSMTEACGSSCAGGDARAEPGVSRRGHGGLRHHGRSACAPAGRAPQDGALIGCCLSHAVPRGRSGAPSPLGSVRSLPPNSSAMVVRMRMPSPPSPSGSNSLGSPSPPSDTVNRYWRHRLPPGPVSEPGRSRTCRA